MLISGTVHGKRARRFDEKLKTLEDVPDVIKTFFRDKKIDAESINEQNIEELVPYLDYAQQMKIKAAMDYQRLEQLAILTKGLLETEHVKTVLEKAGYNPRTLEKYGY